MSRTKIISILVVGALGVAAIFGAVIYRTAFAATPTTTPVMHTGRGFGGGFTSDDLAKALGITVDQLKAAYQKANEAALSQAVEKGLITQAQADQLKANGSAFPFGNRWAGWLSQNGIDYEALLAKELGITVEKLQAAYQQAYYARIDQSVTDGKLTADQADLMKGEYALRSSSDFQSAMKSAYEAAVKQAVSKGVITQAQADKILSSQATLGNKGFGGFPGMKGFGGFGGHEFGRRGGMDDNASGNQALPAVP